MQFDFQDFALTIKAENISIPYGLSDELLFLKSRNHLIQLLSDEKTTITYFGVAPDNTADNQDRLLIDGIFYRIIGYEKNLGIDLESTKSEILKAFKYLIENYNPFWSTIIIEEGLIKKEVTIELLYKDVF
jgi:hypothetical protein